MSYNAGFINITGDAYFDVSGSAVTNFKTTNATVTNLSANVVNTTSLALSNLDVTGTFDVTGLNKYVADYNDGDMISYNLVCHLDASQSWVYLNVNTFELPFFDYSYVQNYTGVSVYELIYWGNDSRSSDDLSRMSATVLIPDDISDSNVLISYKHGTYDTTARNETVWNNLYIYSQTGISYPDCSNNTTDIFSFLTTMAGYTTVVADNPSYGRSSGNYAYHNSQTEAGSQYSATLATIQFLNNINTIPVPTQVVCTGYSLGGMHTPKVVELIESDTSNNLHVINTFAGGVVNAYVLQKSVLSNLTLPTSWYVYSISLLYALTNSVWSNQLLQPNILTDVMPLIDQFYINQFPIGYYGYEFDKIAEQTYKSNYYKTGDTSGTLLRDSSGILGYVYPEVYLQTTNAMNYVNAQLNLAFFTNPFMNWDSISGGQTPINSFYSSYDELCCYDASAAIMNSPYGNPAYDGVKYYARSYATGVQDTSNVTSPWCLSPNNNKLGLTLVENAPDDDFAHGPTDYVEYNPTVTDLTAFVTNEATKLIYSERLGFSSTTTVDTQYTGLGGTHAGTFELWGAVLYNYLFYRNIL
jgi:hypothetical protein